MTEEILNKDKNFVAYYMPALNGNKDPSRGGFPTKDAAWDWVAEKYTCKGCKEEIETNKKWRKSGKKYPPKSFFKSLEEEVDWHQKNVGSSHPACMCEWSVLEKDKLDKCQDFGDIMDAMGAKRI
jgi:hypothetical protein